MDYGEYLSACGDKIIDMELLSGSPPRKPSVAVSNGISML